MKLELNTDLLLTFWRRCFVHVEYLIGLVLAKSKNERQWTLIVATEMHIHPLRSITAACCRKRVNRLSKDCSLADLCFSWCTIIALFSSRAMHHMSHWRLSAIDWTVFQDGLEVIVSHHCWTFGRDVKKCSSPIFTSHEPYGKWKRSANVKVYNTNISNSSEEKNTTNFSR